MEGRFSPLTYANLGFSSIMMVVAIFPLFFIQVIVFRGDYSPDDVRLLSDLAWLPFVGLTGPSLVQWTCIGAVVLLGDRTRQVFPRWIGYVNIWLVLLTLPSFALYFFKTGPLAWDGMFVFWIPLTALAIWTVSMTLTMVRAIKRQAAEAEQPSATEPALEAAIQTAVQAELARMGVTGKVS
jgi:hypothetical protein